MLIEVQNNTDNITLLPHRNIRMNYATAILVFTRTVKEESQEKNFAGNGNAAINLSLSSGFINRTIREVRKSEIPYFIISSDLQRGSSFGERLSNAFTEVFSVGFENVIAIGNDSPQLNAATLIKVSTEIFSQIDEAASYKEGAFA